MSGQHEDRAVERSLTEDLLVSGLDDWSDASWVFSLALDRAGGDPVVARSTAPGLVAALVAGGLAVPGDVAGQGHTPWLSSPEDSIHRITTAWPELQSGRSPSPGSVAWLANTAAGDAHARSVLRREACDGHGDSA